MGILSGYKRFKKYLRTGEGYKLCSEWTKSDSVEMTDGSTLQETMDKLCNILGVSDEDNEENIVSRISDMENAIQILNENLNEVISHIGDQVTYSWNPSNATLTITSK